MTRRETSADANAGAVDTDARWHEYQLSPAGDAVAATHATFVAVFIGISAFAVLGLALGLAVEESGLRTHGMLNAIEALLSGGIFVVIALAFAILFALAVAHGVHDRVASTTLLKAAKADAEGHLVPHPDQMARATMPSFTVLLWFAGMSLVVGGVIYGIVLVADWFGPDVVSAWGHFGAAAFFGVFGGIATWITKVERPRHERQSSEIRSHWPAASQEDLWTRIQRETQAKRVAQATARNTDNEGHLQTRTKRGTALINAGFIALLVAGAGYFLAILFTHPKARISPVADVGDRADLTPAQEQFVDKVVWLLAALLVLGFLLLLVGTLVSGLAQRGERRELTSAVATPTALAPGLDVLQAYSQRRPVLLAQWVATLGGFILCQGLTILIARTGMFARVITDAIDASAYLAALQGPASWAVALSCLLILVAIAGNAVANRRGRELRNSLYGRWPVLPLRAPEPSAAARGRGEK